MSDTKIFPPMKAQIASVEVEPDMGQSVSAWGVITALIEVGTGDISLVHVTYEVRGKEAVSKILQASRDRGEFDFIIGI